MGAVSRFVRMKVNKITKPITIHTEAIQVDSVWEKIKEFASKNKAEWFVLTPVNFEYAKYSIGFEGNKKEYEKIILERYRWLQERGQTIQLHVHVRHLPETVSKKEKEEMIKDGYAWLKSNGFNPTKIVFGWWIHDDVMELMAKKLGLEVVGFYDYYFFHDYDFIKNLVRW